jgi:hypothetical protein
MTADTIRWGAAISVLVGLLACGEDAARPIWTQQSQRIEIGWFSIWVGGYKWQRDRAQLTAVQEQRLAAIQTIEENHACGADEASAEVTVTDTDGKTHAYIADQFAADCNRGGTYVGYPEVAALLDTVHCKSSQSYEAGGLAAAPHIAVSDGCYHGVFSDAGGGGTQSGDWWFLVDVTEPGPHRFTIEECYDLQLRLRLFDAAGETQLASVDSTGDAECPVLDCHLAEAGPHALRVEVLGGTTASDFYLSADRLP